MLLAALVFGFCIGRSLVAASPSTWETPPGWTQTRGGEGGQVIRVSTLAARGPGSLAEAMAAEGPRVIEFAVAGIIDLEGRSLQIRRPHVTIAGETAPSPGITLTNGGVGIGTHDVIVRHIRIRPGAGGRAKGSGWEVDGLATGRGARDVVVDHCSFSWATDENLSASGPRFDGATPDEWRRNTSHRITFSNNIVGECLHDSTHEKGPHSMGTLVHDNATGIALVGNLYISNNDRHPLFKGGARGVVINNLIHNYGERAMQFALNPGEWGEHPWQRGAMVIVGNVVRAGPSTAPGVPLVHGFGPFDLYLADNLTLDVQGRPVQNMLRLLAVRGRSLGDDPASDPRLVDAAPLWPPGLKARPAGEVVAWVLVNAGARPWDRDAVDRRLVEEAGTGKGKIINFESEVGGLAKP